MTVKTSTLFTVYHAKAGEALNEPVYVVTCKNPYCRSNQTLLDTKAEIRPWEIRHMSEQHPKFYRLYGEMI